MVSKEDATLDPLTSLHTFSLIHIFPTVRATEDVIDRFEVHVLAFVVTTVENHLVRTCTTLEAVFAHILLIAWSAVGGWYLTDDEHVAA